MTLTWTCFSELLLGWHGTGCKVGSGLSKFLDLLKPLVHLMGFCILVDAVFHFQHPLCKLLTCKAGPMEHCWVGRLQTSNWSVVAPRMVRNQFGATPLLLSLASDLASLERAWSMQMSVLSVRSQDHSVAVHREVGAVEKALLVASLGLGLVLGTPCHTLRGGSRQRVLEAILKGIRFLSKTHLVSSFVVCTV